jgi:hypothetical protein
MEGFKMKEIRPPFILRSIRFFGSFLLSSIVALGIVILLEIISFNHNLFIDLTPGKIHTFSEQTRKVLESLEKKIEFIAFYRMDDRAELEDFFQRLSNYSSKIKYRLIDLERNPGKAKLYGVTFAQTVIEYNGIRRDIGYPTEERVVNGILKLVQGKMKTVYFSKGHGENEDYADLEKGMENENWKVEDIFLMEDNDLIIDETVVIVAGPQKDFLEREISRLEQYLNKGGKVVLLFEPFTMLPNLEAFLKKYRIALADGIIVDKQEKLAGGEYLTPLISDMFRCSVTKGLSPSARFLFSTVRSLEITEGEASGISILPLLRSSYDSWTKTDMEEIKKGNVDFQEGIDTPGPLKVGIWVILTGEDEDGKKKDGELICFGDSDFITDSYYKVFENKDLFLNALGWLARDKNLISIRPKQVDYPYHFLTAEQGRLLFWVSIIGMPAIFLVISVAIFVFRRVRG